MRIQNLGPISDAHFELNDGLIFLGPNNSGKTYVSYALYGFFKSIFTNRYKLISEDEFLELISKKELKVEKKELSTRFLNQMIKYLEKNKDEILSKTFKVSQDYFSESEIVFEAEKLFTYLFNKFEEKQRINTGIFIDRYLYRLNLQLVDDFLIINIISVEPRSIFMREEESDDIIVPDETSMKQLLKKNYKVLTNFINIRVQDYLFSEPNIIYIPAERNGLNVFRNELLIDRSSMFDSLEKNKKLNESTYPQPISDYLDFINRVQLSPSEKKVDKINKDSFNLFSEKILKGKYEVKMENEVYFRQLYGKNSKGLMYKREEIPFHIASSSAKTLYGLDYYFREMFKEGDILFIDEPEMNLDPNTQIEMAIFLAKCIELGLKVIISTHSDYIIRSFTNYLLSNKVNNKKAQLQYNQVTTYILDENKIKQIDSLINIDNLGIFDNPSSKLEDEYYLLLDNLIDSEDD